MKNITKGILLFLVLFMPSIVLAGDVTKTSWTN